MALLRIGSSKDLLRARNERVTKGGKQKPTYCRVYWSSMRQLWGMLLGRGRRKRERERDTFAMSRCRVR